MYAIGRDATTVAPSRRELASSEDEQPQSDDSICSSSDDEICLLEYARSHGLCTDYTAINPLASGNWHDMPIDSDQDEIGLSELQLPSSVYLEDSEKLYLDKKGIVFLRDVISITNDRHANHDIPYERTKRLRAESPLLSTDTELDRRRFIQTRESVDAFDATEYPSFVGKEDLDKQVEWLDPSLLNTTSAQASSEKLMLTSKETAFLRTVCCDFTSDLGGDTRTEKVSEGQRTEKPAKETPPLLALSSPFSFGVPESPMGYLQLVSDPYDPSKDELAQLDEIILHDAFAPSGSTSDLPYDSAMGSETAITLSSPTNLVATGCFSSPPKRLRPEEFKEDVPLTPDLNQQSPLKKLKTVTFSELLATTIPEYATEFPFDDCETIDDGSDDFFDGIVLPASKVAQSEAEHEQLSEADSTLRLEVPKLDHALPPPPWMDSCRYHKDGTMLGRSIEENHRALLQMLKSSVLREDKPWSGTSIRHIGTWEPFPSHLGRLTLTDELDEDSTEHFISETSFKEIELTTWKPEGLRVMDECEHDDDELEPVKMDTDQASTPMIESMQSLLIRRQHEIDMKVSGSCGGENTSIVLPLIKAPVVEKPPKNYTFITARAREDPAAVTKSRSILDAFSVTTSLTRFIQAQTGTRPQPAMPTAKAKADSLKTNAEVPTLPPPSGHPVDRIIPSTRVPVPIPETNITSLSLPKQFILSSSMLAHRQLIQQIRQRYPAAQLIERDLSMQDMKTDGTSVVNTDEADLLLSPSTGLVFTTLQRIKQKPLPGQINHNGIRDRVSVLAGRYERLILLVSEGMSAPSASDMEEEPMRNLDERDCAALNSLTRDVAQLETNVQVLYVPGAEASLASWAVSHMVRHGIDDPEIQLMHDETLWEMFLRKAGMNAFAAQAVLARLKQPPSGGRSSDFGLSAFVQMHPDERVRRFGRLLGGRKLLDRVSRVIDNGWISEARPHHASRS